MLHSNLLQVHLKPQHPKFGSITDLEDMNLDQKLAFLKEHSNWKCGVKWELLAEHKETWRSNGLSNLSYSVLSRVDGVNDCISRVVVDVTLNGDWSDARAGGVHSVCKHMYPFPRTPGRSCQTLLRMFPPTVRALVREFSWTLSSIPLSAPNVYLVCEC